MLFFRHQNSAISDIITIVSQANNSLTILTSQTGQELTISFDDIDFFQFDPFTHQNLPQENPIISNGEKFVIKKTDKNYEFITMPPVQIFGQITSIDNQILNIVSNGKNQTAKISDQTIFLSPNKDLITFESLAVGEFVFIYSDYSAYYNQTTNIPAASIQIMNK